MTKNKKTGQETEKWREQKRKTRSSGCGVVVVIPIAIGSENPPGVHLFCSPQQTDSASKNCSVKNY